MLLFSQSSQNYQKIWQNSHTPDTLRWNPVGNTTSARRLYVVNPGLEVDRTDLNVQEMSVHEPRLTVAELHLEKEKSLPIGR